MRPDEIRDRLRTCPFEPLRAHLSDGTHHDVRHPEFAAISHRRLVIVDDPGDDQRPDRIVYRDPIRVTKIG